MKYYPRFFHGKTAFAIVLFMLVCGVFRTLPLYSTTEVGAAIEKHTEVIAGGTPFGIKIRSDGVMVISVADNSPAQKAGIKAGDIISVVNGETVNSNAGLAAAIQLQSETSILLRRNDAEILLTLTPVSENGFLKIGAFVRDSAAGIGTLTFYNPENHSFAGLGHAVSDTATGSIVPLGSGEITCADICGIVKGKEGCAGELCGVITPNSDIGSISANTPVGIFGTVTEDFSYSADCLPVAFRSEVRTGKAEIITTADSSGPKRYSIEIERLNIFDQNGSKALVIRITDKELLSLTGGIVRGMSGSPIIQSGKLVGAVTHVFVNDPTRGYAVFADTMLLQCSEYITDD